jgi:RNA polymerase sigma factor (sigma-70 family)
VPRQTWDDGDNVAVQTASTEHVGDDLDEAVATFLGVRPRLMAIAYRFLASTSEAEDIVQETWLRWQRTDRTVVANPQGLLATMTTRLAINVSQSARCRHETSLTPAAPERADPGEDPGTRVEQHEAVEHAVLVILESLTPKERAAFILREAFDYSYGQISEFLHLSAANSRQVVCRARRGIGADRHASVSGASHQRFLRAFLDASRAGDLTGFEELLAADLAAERGAQLDLTG